MGTITVAEIRQKPKRSVIVTTDGKQYGCWTDKLLKLGLEQGGTYNVETESFTTDNGTTLFNIISAKRVTMGGGAEPVPLHPRSQPPAGPVATQFRTPKQLTVTELLVAYIRAGKCANPGELSRAAEDISRMWDSVLAEPVPYDQAAE